MQVLLVLIGAGLLLFAGFSWGRAAGLEDARAANDLTPPRPPGPGQVLVLAGLGLAAVGTAFLLGGPGGVRIPTPARLEEYAGRAEQAARERAARPNEPHTEGARGARAE
jgi:hypothetical protein